MASAAPAARVDDPFGHSSAMNGVLIGLAVGALIGTAILTGGVSLIAVGAAVAITGGAGLAGQAIGQTIEGPETGVITIGSPTVFMNGRPAAMTVIATGPCSQDSGPPVPVATGAATVRIHTQPAARVGEMMACSAIIRRGSDSVFIGGPSRTVIKPTPEVPVWLENTMLAMVIGGTAIGTLGVGLTYGAGAAVGSLVGGTAGGHFGGQAASAGAAALGYGATGQAIAGVAGGMLGGALGGTGGFRGGTAAQVKVQNGLALQLPPAPKTPPWNGNTTKLTPSQEAQSWQGKGPYPGVDRYRDITLKPGTIIHAGEPGQGNYYTTGSALRRAGNSQKALWEGLQVRPDPKFGPRPGTRAYEVMEDTPAGFGVTRANTQYGAGGLPQIYIPDFSKLRPLDVTPLGTP